MDNAWQSRYKRTSPVEEPVPVNNKSFNCTKCTFKTGENTRLREHIRNAHNQNNQRVPVNPGPNPNSNQNYNDRSRQVKQYCHFWNNIGSCPFESKNGRPCTFLHESAPICSFDGQCNRKLCMYVHKRQNKAFLANPPRNFNYPIPPPQGGHWGAPPPWMNQFANPWNQARSRGGKNRRY